MIDDRINIECSFLIDFYYIDRYKAILYLANKINSSDIIGRGKEHDSIHYVEDTYIKWKIDNTEIKLFWCDEKDNKNKFCFDISYTKQTEKRVIQLKEFIKSKFKNISCEFY